ncbi:ATPase [Clostridium novyi A str. 4570]|uniref:ATPase n=1 Tax=Clostridium novyi A str. 4570 TaxID=1444290 RepID=A0AA88ZUK4_CLONO|nr:ATPase [Clostridium novyi]KGN02893.1 ATPase [Clostridium novyi A str. 4570]
MEIMKLLEYLQEIIETSHNLPVVGKIVVQKKEVLDIIEQIIEYLPDELKKAQWICEEKERILGNAHIEADNIKRESYEILKKEIERHSLTKEAKVKAETIIASAKRDAKTIKMGAREYADEILCQLEKEISIKSEQLIYSIKQQTEEYVKNVQCNTSNTTKIIRENIKELRDTGK